MSLHNPSQHKAVSSYRPLELAPILGIGRSTIYKLLRSGRIRSIKAGRCTLIPADAVTDFLKGRQ